MKKQFIIILVCLLGLGTQANAQGVGVVSRNLIFQSMPVFVKDLKMIDSLQKKYTLDLNYENQILQEQARKIMVKYNPSEKETFDDVRKKMNKEDGEALDKVIAKIENLDKKKEQNQQYVIKLQKEKIEPILSKIDLIIRGISNEEQLDIMFYIEDIGETAAFISEKKDYTSKVIAKLKSK